MADSRLIRYLQNGLSRNVDSAVLKKDLIRQGFSESEVESAYDEVMKTYSFGANTFFYKVVKRFILFLILMGVISLAYVGYMVLSFEEIVLSDDNLLDGVSYTMETAKLDVVLGDSVNKIRIIDFDSEKVDFYLNDFPERLFVNQSRPFDLNFDLSKDTVIEFLGVESEMPVFNFINYTDCISEWDCSSWTLCKNKKQTRKCLDLNECGLNETMPIVFQECEGILDIPIIYD